MDNFWKTIDMIFNCIISSLDKFREYLNSGPNSESKKFYASIIGWAIGLTFIFGFKRALGLVLFFAGCGICIMFVDILRKLKVADKICLWWKGFKQPKLKGDQ